MHRYQLSYESINTYSEPVSGAFYKFLIYPFLSYNLQITRTDFKVSINGDWWESRLSDQQTTALFFKAAEKFKRIEFLFEGELTMEDVILPMITPLENEQELLLDKEWMTENYSYLFSDPRRKSYLPSSIYIPFEWNHQLSLWENVRALGEWIHEYIEFQAGITDTSTEAQEVLSVKKGVCQDFVHLFLGIIRNHQIPARYVSGYLFAGGNDQVRGNLQLHAWVEVNLPGQGWIGLDPTNNLLIDHHYVKVCHGYDYDDCMPVAGVIQSAAQKQKTEYEVKIQALAQNQ